MLMYERILWPWGTGETSSVTHMSFLYYHTGPSASYKSLTNHIITSNKGLNGEGTDMTSVRAEAGMLGLQFCPLLIYLCNGIETQDTAFWQYPLRPAQVHTNSFSPSCWMRKGLGYRKLTWARIQLSQTWIFKGDRVVISAPGHAIERLGQWDTKRSQRRNNLWRGPVGATVRRTRLMLR